MGLTISKLRNNYNRSSIKQAKMSDNLLQILDQKLAEIKAYSISNLQELEQFRVSFLGSKNSIKPLMDEMKNIAPELRKEYGQKINLLKNTAESILQSHKESLEAGSINSKKEIPDLSLPVKGLYHGSRHPSALTMNQIIRIFTRLGFTISKGPEIEDDWHNFTALNFPPDHPARDMQDTYFIEEDIALRTHTSSVQVRVMEHNKPPIRTISPGRVYRNETISARSHCQFHQVEGLYVDEGVSFADLKQTLDYFAKEMFGHNTNIRLRPSYFPFTEVSAEVDVSCFVCNAKGCNICKYSGWVEILGCGMVDPNVLSNCGIDPERYTGFAFGMGVERIAMLKYKINDIRLLFENDLRFLQQFSNGY